MLNNIVKYTSLYKVENKDNNIHIPNINKNDNNDNSDKLSFGFKRKCDNDPFNEMNNENDNDSYTTTNSHSSSLLNEDDASSSVSKNEINYHFFTPKKHNSFINSCIIPCETEEHIISQDCEFGNFFTDDNDTKEFKNITVCYINIPNYSKWCSSQNTIYVVNAIKQYNKHILSLLSQYSHLNKIKLSCNNCIIIGGLNDESNRHVSLLNMIKFCTNLLKSLPRIQKIFANRSFGIRIGLHISDAVGVLLTNPKKFELFGNDMNFCYELSNNSLKNTLHISHKTLSVLHSIRYSSALPPLYMDFIRDNIFENNNSTIGHCSSCILHLKIKDILFFSETKSLLDKYLEHTIVTNCEHNQNIKYLPVIGDISISFTQMYSFFWEHVVFILYNPDIIHDFSNQILEFRKWEKNRTPQNIIVVCDTHLLGSNSIIYDLCTVLSNDSSKESIMRKIQRLIKLNSNLNLNITSRISLDLE